MRFFLFVRWRYSVSVGLGVCCRAPAFASLDTVYLYLYTYIHELYWFALKPLLYCMFHFVSFRFSVCVCVQVCLTMVYDIQFTTNALNVMPNILNADGDAHCC